MTRPLRDAISLEKQGVGLPLTVIAAEAFQSQMEVAGAGPWLFPTTKSPTGYQTTFKKTWERTLRKAGISRHRACNRAPRWGEDSSNASGARRRLRPGLLRISPVHSAVKCWVAARWDECYNKMGTHKSALISGPRGADVENRPATYIYSAAALFPRHRGGGDSGGVIHTPGSEHQERPARDAHRRDSTGAS
jgi:hypothetical protein